MGRPADISARLRFMFPGCLKQAGTLSNGHRTAKEEVPLTGERGESAPWGHQVKVERGRREMFHRVCTVTLRASQGRRFGETLQMMPPDNELMAAFRPDMLFYPRIKYLLQGESQHSLLQGLQAARLLFFFLRLKIFNHTD